MITIIHGTDTTLSRDLFFEAKGNAKNIVLLEGEGLVFDTLFQAIENKSLFDEEATVFIENFLTKNKSNTTEFKKIATYLNISKSSVFLWENTEITKTTLSQFPKAEVKSFTLPQNLFLFLDNIIPNNSSNSIKLFHELIKVTAPELIFFMILRQFRILMATSSTSSNSIDETRRLAPWQMSKFKKQLGLFGQEKLESAYKKLFEIEQNHKTGKVSYPIDKSIDFFLAGL